MNAQEAGAAGRGASSKSPARLAGPTGSREALLVASCVLEVLAGMRRPMEAAEALKVSLARYYQLEQRALEALVQGCEPLRRGRASKAGPELQRLRQENERLKRECQRQQALVRLARQAAGLTAPVESPTPGKKKRRITRGQQAAQRMKRAAEASKEAPSAAIES